MGGRMKRIDGYNEGFQKLYEMYIDSEITEENVKEYVDDCNIMMEKIDIVGDMEKTIWEYDEIVLQIHSLMENYSVDELTNEIRQRILYDEENNGRWG